MSTFFTKILLLLIIPVSVFSQKNVVSTDSVVQKQKFGLRVGLDLNKLINSSINNNYNGFELNADYRISDKLYIASEIGLTENTEDEEYLNFTSKGTYIKSGIDYNMYTNWLDMQNMILNSLAMEFLMMLDNEFEELYFQYLPGAADDIYDNIFVSYDENIELLEKRQKKDSCFKCFSCVLFIPYKLLVISVFLFPVF